MPRLSDATYLANRGRLGADWFDHHAYAMSRLTFRDQRTLHDFYVLTKDLTDEQAIKHRVDSSKAHPDLPQHAGKSFAAFAAVPARPDRIRTLATTSRRSGHRQDRRITVRGLVRPEIDTPKLVRVLLAMAERDADQPPV
jgi:hypothetical protein